MTGLDWKGAVADISGAVAFLKAQGAKKVGVTGFCMGGALTIAVATTDPDVSALAPFYGVPDFSHWKLSNIKGPIFAHFGELDQMKGFSAPEDGHRLEAAAKEAGL